MSFVYNTEHGTFEGNDPSKVVQAYRLMLNESMPDFRSRNDNISYTREFSSYFSSLVTLLPVKQGLATTLWKGYQVSGRSVFKCEMSSKVVRHMIWVTAWQCCTYGADLEDRKREEHDNLSTLHCTTVTSWRSVLLSKHRMVISTVQRPYSNILGYSQKK